MILRRAAAGALPSLLLGCGGMNVPPGPVPAEIPALRAELDRDSTALPARLRLAEAYRLAGQADAARLLLEPYAAANPLVAVELGLVYEDLERFAEARRVYRDYLERGRDARLRDQVRARLTLLERRELEQAVRAALAREQELANVTPAPNTVGVFPFLAVTDDPELRALGTALAELLTTDLAQTDRLRVLERTQVQALLAELQLAESGRVDPATAARTGRLLGAGSVVQGRIETTAANAALQAVVVNVPGQPQVPAPLREQDTLARLLDMEKRLALALYERMGVQLTAAERQRVTRQATDNVQALVAFGFGLEAADAGNYDEAARQFRRALSLDPGFDLARTQQTRAEQSALAATVTAGALSRLGLAEAGAADDWRARYAPVEALMLDPALRDAAAEVLGAEGPRRSGTADIVIRRPGGTP
jgi:TolB-like protein